MLVILLGVGQGLKNGTNANFGDVTNVIFIWSGGRTQIAHGGLAQGRWITLRSEDVERIKERIPEVAFAGGFNRLGGWGSGQYIVRGDKGGPFSVRGSHPGMAHLHSLEVSSGRFIHQLDWDERRKTAVVGRCVQHGECQARPDTTRQSSDTSGVSFT